jgi:hypothetical protein
VYVRELTATWTYTGGWLTYIMGCGGSSTAAVGAEEQMTAMNSAEEGRTPNKAPTKTTVQEARVELAQANAGQTGGEEPKVDMLKAMMSEHANTLKDKAAHEGAGEIEEARRRNEKREADKE